MTSHRHSRALWRRCRRNVIFKVILPTPLPGRRDIVRSSSACVQRLRLQTLIRVDIATERTRIKRRVSQAPVNQQGRLQGPRKFARLEHAQAFLLIFETVVPNGGSLGFTSRSTSSTGLPTMRCGLVRGSPPRVSHHTATPVSAARVSRRFSSRQRTISDLGLLDTRKRKRIALSSASLSAYQRP